MSNYAVVINNVIEDFIHLTDYAYQNAPASLRANLVIETSNTGNIFIGGTYDSSNNIFMQPSPYPSWSYDFVTKQWVPPTPRPDEGETSQQYSWVEATKSWVGNGIQVKRISANT